MRSIRFEGHLAELRRLADALERLAPPAAPAAPDLSQARAFAWEAERSRLLPVPRVAAPPLMLLHGIARARDILLANTRRFAQSLPANNALLWGVRGMGKSSLVKAVHQTVAAEADAPLLLIEIHREDLASLPALMALAGGLAARAIVFCDDLSFETADASYKSLKAALEGGLAGRPANVLFYATSNRRHLMAREMIENERGGAIHPGEAVEEKVSLSDRFGLWLGFHACDQEAFLEMVAGYCRHYALGPCDAGVRAAALEWAATRGARSGRVAWQFIQDLAGARGLRLEG